MSESIHDFIKAIRIEQRLSIQALSKVSGVSASHISRIECSNRKPSPQTLKKLAPHLNVEYITLLEKADMLQRKTFEVVEFEELIKGECLYYQGRPVSTDTKALLIAILMKPKEE